MTDPMDIDRYLDRIRYRGSREPSVRALCALHEAHLLAVPFENLDIHIGRAIRLDPGALLDKVVTRGRGGFCYELNGLFAHLLGALGYDVTMLSARVFNADGALGPEHDHLTLLVDCDGPWLVDVGFGDAFVTPLSLADDRPQVQRARAHRVTRADRDLIYASQDDGEPWKDQYVFTLIPRSLGEFFDMCQYHQSSPDSHFTRKRVITRLTASGRVTLRDDRLIVTEHGRRTEHPIADDHAWRAALQREFGVAARDLDRAPAAAVNDDKTEA